MRGRSSQTPFTKCNLSVMKKTLGQMHFPPQNSSAHNSLTIAKKGGDPHECRSHGSSRTEPSYTNGSASGEVHAIGADILPWDLISIQI
jgi:hypothetical protein